MAGSLTIHVGVRGLGNFRAYTAEARRAAAAEMDAFMRGQLAISRTAIMAATPVRTGLMRRSWEVISQGPRAYGLENTTLYATFLFTGTIHMSQNRGLVAAMNDQSQRIRGAFAQQGSRLAIIYARGMRPGGGGD